MRESGKLREEKKRARMRAGMPAENMRKHLKVMMM
jgi:hypothetical protein